MPKQHVATIAKATISEGENVSEIQSLTDRAESLSQSVDWWNAAMIWALVLAAIAAIVVVATTRLAITSAKQLSDAQNELMKAKDRQLAIDLRDKDAKIAEAVARAAEANLALEKFKAPRQIKGTEFVKAFEGKPKAPVEIVFVRDDTDSFHLAMQIAHWLKIANWQVSEPAAIVGPDEPRFATSPSAVQAGGNASGVTIVHRMTSEAEYEHEGGLIIPGLTPIDTPGKALRTALVGSLGQITTMMNLETGKIGTLRIVVGSKP